MLQDRMKSEGKYYLTLLIFQVRSEDNIKKVFMRFKKINIPLEVRSWIFDYEKPKVLQNIVILLPQGNGQGILALNCILLCWSQTMPGPN